MSKERSLKERIERIVEVKKMRYEVINAKRKKMITGKIIDYAYCLVFRFTSGIRIDIPCTYIEYMEFITLKSKQEKETDYNQASGYIGQEKEIKLSKKNNKMSIQEKIKAVIESCDNEDSMIYYILNKNNTIKNISINPIAYGYNESLSYTSVFKFQKLLQKIELIKCNNIEKLELKLQQFKTQYAMLCNTKEDITNILDKIYLEDTILKIESRIEKIKEKNIKNKIQYAIKKEKDIPIILDNHYYDCFKQYKNKAIIERKEEKNIWYPFFENYDIQFKKHECNRILGTKF
jgi:hypothetical protein